MTCFKRFLLASAESIWAKMLYRDGVRGHYSHLGKDNNG